MSINTDRNTLRQTFIEAWQKYQAQQTLNALQQQIVAILLRHPEYHDAFNQPEQLLEQEYATDNNPFLHLSLHLSLQEQINTNRPHGIAAAYQQLLKTNDQHRIEHAIIDILASSIWEAQQTGVPPNEQEYLQKVRALAEGYDI